MPGRDEMDRGTNMETEQVVVIIAIGTSNDTELRDGINLLEKYPQPREVKEVGDLCWTWGFKPSCGSATNCACIKLTRLFGRLLRVF